MNNISLPQNSNMLKKDFTYGVATASFQIEGGVKDRLPCIWDTFCNKENTIVDGSNGDIACDHYNRWQDDIELINSDLHDVNYTNAKLILSNYTLQFIRPLQREKLVKRIFDSLEDEGIFIFSEKVISSNSKLNKQSIDEYYEFKKTQGYSEFEISQKREALENVLIPYTEEENKKMILDAGFSHCETIFKWVNFATFIAIK